MAKAQPIVGLDLEQPILLNAALVIETRLGEMLNYEPFIDKEDRVLDLHQMRIAAKRLRYTMEIFQPLYADHTESGAAFNQAIDEIKAIQEHLGEIHDADVLAPQLTQHLARLIEPAGRQKRGDAVTVGVHLVDYDACQGILTLCRDVRDERDNRYQRFLSDWRQLREKEFFENLAALIKRAAVDASDCRPAPDTGPSLAEAKT